MISIDHCTVEEFGSGYKATADEGYALYNMNAYSAWEDYCTLSEENAEEFPEKTLFEFISFSHVVYFPATADGSNFGVMAIEDGMKVF